MELLFHTVAQGADVTNDLVHDLGGSKFPALSARRAVVMVMVSLPALDAIV